MVGVNGDGLVGDGGDHELRDLAIRAAALQGHSFFRIEIVRQQAALDFLDQLVMALAVGLIGFDANALAVADRHAFYSLVETRNDLAATDLEFEGIIWVLQSFGNIALQPGAEVPGTNRKGPIGALPGSFGH